MNSVLGWVIEDLDGLKSMLIKMIIFILAVSFTGRIVTYAGEMDILYQGAGLAAVVLALTYFLHKKSGPVPPGPIGPV